MLLYTQKIYSPYFSEMMCELKTDRIFTTHCLMMMLTRKHLPPLAGHQRRNNHRWCYTRYSRHKFTVHQIKKSFFCWIDYNFSIRVPRKASFSSYFLNHIFLLIFETMKNHQRYTKNLSKYKENPLLFKLRCTEKYFSAEYWSVPISYIKNIAFGKSPFKDYSVE